MKICFLGSGTSQGVPVIGKQYPDDFLANPKNHRLRPAIYLETEQVKIVVDTPPEFRIQCLRENICALDAVLITHPHADHMMGLDDCRRFCDMMGDKPLPIYASQSTMDVLKNVFFYAFKEGSHPHGYFVPEPHIVDKPFQIGDLTIRPEFLIHGRFISTGYLFIQNGIKKLAYLTDCKIVPDEVIEDVKGCELLIIDGLRHRLHPTHLSLQEALNVSEKIQPKTTYLTHLTHSYDHDRDEALITQEHPTVHLSYDGLWLTL